MSQLPDVLTLNELGEGRFRVTQPTESAEGRDVVFSGQYISQMLMAAEAMETRGKEVRSIHTLFCRTSSYAKPLELEVEVLQSGRTWGSESVTARQDGRLRARSLVLFNSADPDLMRHEASMPKDVPQPDTLQGTSTGLVFPGVDWRPVPGDRSSKGVPIMWAWHRFTGAASTVSVNQAVLSWSSCGQIIGLAFGPHRHAIDIGQAHRTLSTGVMSHSIHFLEPIDVSQWLLFTHTASKAANGRVFGGGQVFTQEGRLIAAFSQDAMAKRAETELDFSRAM